MIVLSTLPLPERRSRDLKHPPSLAHGSPFNPSVAGEAIASYAPQGSKPIGFLSTLPLPERRSRVCKLNVLSIMVFRTKFGKGITN
ncbi:MAG: hypothetical protein F6K09_20190 [Merismopedia sp. SIO2A8]|nr:hypothetical protein [Merismopedia sp. SIO2A8]